MKDISNEKKKLYSNYQDERYVYHSDVVGLGLWYLTPLSTIFHLFHGVSFTGGGNRSTWKKPPTCSKSTINFITGHT